MVRITVFWNSENESSPPRNPYNENTWHHAPGAKIDSQMLSLHVSIQNPQLLLVLLKRLICAVAADAMTHYQKAQADSSTSEFI